MPSTYYHYRESAKLFLFSTHQPHSTILFWPWQSPLGDNSRVEHTGKQTGNPVSWVGQVQACTISSPGICQKIWHMYAYVVRHYIRANVPVQSPRGWTGLIQEWGRVLALTARLSLTPSSHELARAESYTHRSTTSTSNPPVQGNRRVTAAITDRRAKSTSLLKSILIIVRGVVASAVTLIFRRL